VTAASDVIPRAEVSAAMRRSAAFVESAGDEIAIARARALVGAQPASSVVDLLLDVGPETSVGRLLWTLGILDDLRCASATPVERACDGLAASQQSDGSWSDGASAAEDERIFATGMIAGYLAKTPFVRQSTLDAAADYLAARWSPDRVKGSAWGANAAYSHCFALVRHEQADAILQWCGRELERGFLTGVYDAVRTARVFALCKAHALPGSRLAGAELVARILDEQMDDGGYASPGDPSRRARVSHTLDALAALEHLA
jgi:hypothetical protein